MTTVFREPAPPREEVEQPEPDKGRLAEDIEELRPIEDDQDVLEALGVEDDIKVLPQEDYQDFQELKDYLKSYMEEKGLPQTIKGMQKAIANLKEDSGLDEDADPQAVIKKIGGISRSWKELSFVRNLDEKKKILARLLGASTKDEMDSIIFDEMNRKRVWQQ